MEGPLTLKIPTAPTRTHMKNSFSSPDYLNKLPDFNSTKNSESKQSITSSFSNNATNIQKFLSRDTTIRLNTLNKFSQDPYSERDRLIKRRQGNHEEIRKSDGSDIIKHIVHRSQHKLNYSVKVNKGKMFISDLWDIKYYHLVMKVTGLQKSLKECREPSREEYKIRVQTLHENFEKRHKSFFESPLPTVLKTEPECNENILKNRKSGLNMITEENIEEEPDMRVVGSDFGGRRVKKFHAIVGSITGTDSPKKGIKYQNFPTENHDDGPYHGHGILPPINTSRRTSIQSVVSQNNAYSSGISPHGYIGMMSPLVYPNVVSPRHTLMTLMKRPVVSARKNEGFVCLTEGNSCGTNESSSKTQKGKGNVGLLEFKGCANDIMDQCKTMREEIVSVKDSELKNLRKMWKEKGRSQRVSV